MNQKKAPLYSISRCLLVMLIGCAVFAATARAEIEFKSIRTADVVTMLSAGPTVRIFDANNAETRTQEGVVPGATLLSSASDYDVAKTLPANKNERLVFYCANERCSASHTAAKRATVHGYTNVYVMADGIQGWRKAGQQTAK